MCTAAISGLSTVASMGYSLSIPDYFLDILVFVLVLVLFLSLVRVVYEYLRESSVRSDDIKK